MWVNTPAMISIKKKVVCAKLLSSKYEEDYKPSKQPDGSIMVLIVQFISQEADLTDCTMKESSS